KERKKPTNLFHGRPPCESEDWAYFVDAKSLALKYDYSDDKYIEAQFYYFKKWYNFLPKPHHLSSEKALIRSIDYDRAFTYEEMSEEESREQQTRLLKRLMKIWYKTKKEALYMFGGDRGLFTERFVKDEVKKDNDLRDCMLMTFKALCLNRYKNLTPLDRCCFLSLLIEALENFYDEFKERKSTFIWIPQKKICIKLRMTSTTLQKSLKHLKELGLIDTKQDGKRTLTRIFVPDSRTEEEIKKDAEEERQRERFDKYLEQE
ncbi:unnamed protein product, partial [marine sediment metagenome]